MRQKKPSQRVHSKETKPQKKQKTKKTKAMQYDAVHLMRLLVLVLVVGGMELRVPREVSMLVANTKSRTKAPQHHPLTPPTQHHTIYRHAASSPLPAIQSPPSARLLAEKAAVPATHHPPS